MNWKQPKVYAVKHKDEATRVASRSGGIFTALSDQVLSNGGVVYGCVLTDKFDAVHIRADNEKDRNRMRGSKYIQSKLGDTFKSVKADLDAQNSVLFSGTSCQVAGLKKYLGKEYDNLFCVDIVCHGVPSKKVWNAYLRWQKQKNHSEIAIVDFRNKKDFGWHDHVETLYFENGKLKAKIELVGMEKKMEDNTYDLTTILAKSNMLIYYSDLFKNNCDSIEKIQELSEQLLNKVITSSHTTLGTLENLYLDKYDLILANPPYYQSAAISEASKSVKIYGTETKAYTSGGRGIEALFTEWIVKSIKKGGIANIILPDGIFTNIGNNKLKQLIIENCYIDSIISLPVGTFFNTPKKTFILTIHKRTEEEMNKIQSYPVYTYLCSTIGETMDTYRFDIDENDLHDAVDLYNLYRGNKENKIAISAVNDNPRAKLIPVDKFGIEENWNIELFWSDEEKIELGIKKKDTIMSLEEFHGYISELIDDIKNYQEAIECLK